MAEVVKEERDRWSSRVTFILGAIGSAVGLGNLWRFPFLTFRYGGGTFLIPYVMALFGFGIPLLLLELTLGRNFQGGDPVCFSAMHPRLVGIGFMSAFASFNVAAYYTAIIAWSVVFFFNSFKDPLPWAVLEATNETTGADRLGGAIGFFFDDVLELSSGPDVQEALNPVLVISFIFVWVCVFLSIFQGVGIVSQVVKVSVPVPLLMLVILLFNSVGREGASDGIDAYIGNWDLSQLSDAGMWQAAVGQIFFSIGVCFGIMTAYSSYMESKKGLLLDTTIIAISNSGISFFAGFVVFTTVGVLANDLGVDFDDADFVSRISGPSLAFIAYPAALASLDTAPQVFSAIFFVTIFFLAIDSAFSIVEAVVTALADTNYGRTIQREKLVAQVCFFCFGFGFFFITDNGLYMLDIVDFYVNNMVMLAVGGLECIAAMWIYGMEEDMIVFGQKPILYFYLISLGSVLGSGFIFAYVDNPLNLVLGFSLWVIGILIGMYIALVTSSSTIPDKFYKLLYGGGASKMIQLMTKNELEGRESPTFTLCLHIWAFLIKYLIPSGLIMLVINGTKANFDDPYAGYEQGWQNVGNFVTLFAFAIFILFIINRIEFYSEKHEAHQAGEEAALIAAEDDEKEKEKDLI